MPCRSNSVTNMDSPELRRRRRKSERGTITPVPSSWLLAAAAACLLLGSSTVPTTCALPIHAKNQEQQRQYEQQQMQDQERQFRRHLSEHRKSHQIQQTWLSSSERSEASGQSREKLTTKLRQEPKLRTDESAEYGLHRRLTEMRQTRAQEQQQQRAFRRHRRRDGVRGARVWQNRNPDSKKPRRRLPKRHGHGASSGYLGCLGLSSYELYYSWIFPGSAPSCGYVQHCDFPDDYYTKSNHDTARWDTTTVEVTKTLYTTSANDDDENNNVQQDVEEEDYFVYYAPYALYDNWTYAYYCREGAYATNQDFENVYSADDDFYYIHMNESDNGYYDYYHGGGGDTDGGDGYYEQYGGDEDSGGGGNAADGGNNNGGGGWWNWNRNNNNAANNNGGNGGGDSSNGGSNNNGDYSNNGNNGGNDWNQGGNNNNNNWNNANNGGNHNNNGQNANDGGQNGNDGQNGDNGYYYSNENNQNNNNQNYNNGNNADNGDYYYNNNGDNNNNNAGGDNSQYASGYQYNDGENQIYNDHSDSTWTDPYADFRIDQCDTYENLWLWDLSLTCKSQDSLDDCECAFAGMLFQAGLLSCSDAYKCPGQCPICSTCMALLGCSITSNDTPFTSWGHRRGMTYAIVAASIVAFFIFLALVFLLARSRDNRRFSTLELLQAQLMPPHVPLRDTGGGSPDDDFRMSMLGTGATVTTAPTASTGPTVPPAPPDTQSTLTIPLPPPPPPPPMWLAPQDDPSSVPPLFVPPPTIDLPNDGDNAPVWLAPDLLPPGAAPQFEPSHRAALESESEKEPHVVAAAHQTINQYLQRPQGARSSDSADPYHTIWLAPIS